MRRLPDNSLAAFNSFGVAARAGEVVALDHPDDLPGIGFDPGRDLLLGGGSNLLLAADLPGTAYLVRFAGRRLLSADGDTALVEAAGGEDWHALVRWSLAEGLCGLENLSLIPGTVGAAPMQNIGAYGVEIASCLESLTAFDLRDGGWREFKASDCGFAYRDSRFKTAEPDRWLITSVRLRLNRQFTPCLGYAGLREALAGIAAPTASQVSDAVIAIRRSKLPDPAGLGNAGSFFKNPVLARAQGESLRAAFPGLPGWAAGEGRMKLSAGWLLEHCGWKGHREGDAGFAPAHALVLVNHGRASGAELLDLAARAAHSVHERFGLWLEPEPRIIGAAWPHPLESPP